VSDGAGSVIRRPSSLDQEVGLAARAGEQRRRKVAQDSDLTRFRRARETPVNLVLEGRP
jgi:hypothetical protein